MNKRNIYITVLLLFFALGANAQSEVKYKAIEEAFANTLHKYTAFVADTVAEHLTRRDHDPALCVALARGYFRDREIDRAHKYLDKALNHTPSYGPAYEAYGDIENYYLRYDSAAFYYEKAIRVNPEYIKPYSKYAKIVGKTDPEKAVAILQQARQYDKDYDSDVESANVWFSAEGVGNQTMIEKTIESFSKADSTKLSKYDLGNYALAEWMSQNYNRSIEICNYGLDRFPHFLTLARVRFYDELDRKDYDGAEKAANYLFNDVDSASYVARDYFYMARYYVENNDIAKASKELAKVYRCNDNEAMEFRENSNKLIQSYVENQKAVGNYTQAEDAWSTYIKIGRPQDLDNSYFWYLLSETYKDHIYAVQSDTTLINKQQIIEKLAQELDDVYANMQAAYPDYETELIAYFRANNQCNFDDEHATLGTAEPYYRHVIDIVEPIRIKNDRHITFLVGAYSYMAIYYFFHDDNKRALTYANKVLSVDPTNATAQQIISLLGNKKTGRK